jgi:transcription initiation factor IIE alpha subunit
MLTEYEMQRLAKLIVNGLVNDDRFVTKVAKMVPQKNRTIKAKEVAKILGISVWTVRDIAAYLGGTRKGDEKRGQWVFEENGLVERYQEYCRRS